MRIITIFAIAAIAIIPANAIAREKVFYSPLLEGVKFKSLQAKKVMEAIIQDTCDPRKSNREKLNESGKIAYDNNINILRGIHYCDDAKRIPAW
jgi:hypothetical protein